MAKFTASVPLNIRLPGGYEITGAAGATQRVPDELVEEFIRDVVPTIPGGVTWITQDEMSSPAFTSVVLASDTATITMGTSSDVNLYRGAANKLHTDDELVAYIGFTGIRTSADLNAVRARISGDTFERVAMRAGGQIDWSSGTAAADVNLYRASAGLLVTDDMFYTHRDSASDGGFGTAVGSDTAYRWTITAAGIQSWSAGSGNQDTNLYRGGADLLVTDDKFNASTSFPSTPLTGLRWFRTDLGMEFYYNGTRWLSTTLYSLPSVIASSSVSTPLTATTAPCDRFVLYKMGGYDLWVEDFIANFYVVGGTALSASHKWVGTTFPDVGTITIDSGATDTWRQSVTAADVAFGVSNIETDITWTKTGTPGSLYAYTTLTYRVEAT